MAVFNYDPLVATAAGLMERFGTHGCRVLRPAGVDVAADKPWKGLETGLADQVVPSDVTIMPGSISRLHVGGPVSRRVQGSQALTLAESSTAFMCTDGDKVQNGDYIEFPLEGGGVDRIEVRESSPVKPGGKAIIWQLELGA